MLVCLAKAFKEEDIAGVNVVDEEEADSGIDGDVDQRRLPESSEVYPSMLALSSL